MITVESDQRLAWISTKHNPFVMSLYQGLPGKKKFKNGIPYFDPSRANIEYIDLHCDQVVWKGPAKALRESFISLREREKQTRLDKLDTSEVKVDFEFKTKPYEHQLKAFSLSRGRAFFAYFMEQGTGKTKVLLDVAADIFLNGGEEGPIDSVMIIAPNGVHRQWILEQIPTHFSDQISYKAAYTTANPDDEERRAMAEMLAFSSGLRILAVHVDYLSSKKGLEFVQEFLRTSSCFGIVDESTRFKDKSSKRTENLLNLSSMFKYRRIATGTPVSQGPQDLYTQLSFLSPDILGFSNFYGFRNRYCRMGGFQNKKIIGIQNEEELLERIDSHSFRVLKDDCLDLPPKVIIHRPVMMTDEQKKAYKELKEQFFLELESGAIMTVKMAMTRITRLRQIVNGFLWIREKKVDGQIVTPEMYQEFPSNRANECVEILNESRSDQKFIIWIKFEGDLRALSKVLDKAKISWVPYVGTLSGAEADANLEKFQKDPSVKVLVASAQKGGTGLNLTVASNIIWFSRDYSLENELQANDRIHRIGQTQTVVYHYLYSPGTVDEKIDKIQQSKLAVATSLIDFKDFV